MLFRSIYAIGRGSNYTSCFHDITTGDNGTLFAVPGYDLCTGWGTPAGQPLIDALAPPNALSISPGRGFTAANGPAGRAFNLSSQDFVLTNAGAASLDWSLVNTSLWLNVSPSGGTLTPGGVAVTVNVSLSAAATTLPPGTYAATLWFTNLNDGVTSSRQFTLLVGQPLVQNGGFETGDFSYWTTSGTFDTNWWNLVGAGGPDWAPGPSFPHSGGYFAWLGDYWEHARLSQSLQTMPGQSYLLSFWLWGYVGPIWSPTYANEFLLSWNGSMLLRQTNMVTSGWTNMRFVVQAAGTSSDLQFGFASPSSGAFGFDDVSVTPLPVPTLQAVTQTSNTLAFAWNAMTGLGYQVQFKADLAQTNWTNLGSSIVATNSTASASDVIGPAAQCFYRVVLVP